MKQERPGKVVIISSPSGGGKTSICRRLLTEERKNLGWRFSVSYTTRQKRNGEVDGREYIFVTREEFDEKVAEDFFAEYFEVHSYYYGTPRQPLEEVARNGGVMLLDVDVQGAARLRKEYPEAISIFVLPPSIEELKRRLDKRGTESEKQMQLRFDNAKNEMKEYNKFEYTVINEDLEEAVAQVLAIIIADPCRTENLLSEQIVKRIS